MIDTSCFSPDELQEYALGLLPEDSSARVASHLETCPPCEATVAALDRHADTLVQSLQQAPGLSSNSTPAYDRAIRQVKGLVPAEHGSSAAAADRIRDYELLETIGQGGMGTVYQARHAKLNRLVALKLLPARRLSDAQAIHRFQREMRIVGQLNHPAIVQATDAGEMNGTHFLAMEFVDGFDLAQLVGVCGPLPVAAACEIAREAALGLQHAHQQDMVHRDIKPSNVMVARDGQVKILDLGLALLGGVHGTVDELTTVGQLMGTLDYMAPEQCDNSHTVDARADIYSLGATLYKLLTGDAPYADERWASPVQKLRALASETVPAISTRRGDLPSELEALVHRCLARHAEDRFATMSDLADALQPWCAGSDLRQLCGVAREQQVNDRQRAMPSSLISPPVDYSHNRAAPAEKQQVAKPPTGPRWRPLAWSFAALLMIAATTIIYLNTGQGQLVIETTQPGVRVRIMRAGTQYDSLQLTHESQTLQVGVGNYEVQLEGAHDGLMVEDGVIAMQRNGKAVARIVRRPQSAPQQAAAEDEPLYDGMTWSQWRKIIEQDRSPQRVVSALTAIKSLGKDRPLPVAAAILAAARTQSLEQMAKTPDGTMTLGQYLVMQLPADRDVRCDAIVAELRAGNSASRAWVLSNLAQFDLQGTAASNSLLREVLRAAGDDDRAVRLAAVRNVNAVTDRHAQAIYEKSIQAEDADLVLSGGARLVATPFDRQKLVAAVLPILDSGTSVQRRYAANILRAIGPDAKSAVPRLTERILSTDDALWQPAKQDPDTQAAGVASLALDATIQSARDAIIVALSAIGAKTDKLMQVLAEEPKRRAEYRERHPQTPMQFTFGVGGGIGAGGGFGGNVSPAFDIVGYTVAKLNGEATPEPQINLGGFGGGFPAMMPNDDTPRYDNQTYQQWMANLISGSDSETVFRAIQSLAPEQSEAVIDQHLAHWKRELRLERSPANIARAASILALLGRKQHARELASLFLEVARQRAPQHWEDNASYARLLASLATLDKAALIAAFTAEAEREGANALAVVTDVLLLPNRPQSLHPLAEFASLVPAMLKAGDVETQADDDFAGRFRYVQAALAIEPTGDRVAAALVSWAGGDDPTTAVIAAGSLVDRSLRPADAAAALARLARSTDPTVSREALQWLASLVRSTGQPDLVPQPLRAAVDRLSQRDLGAATTPTPAQLRYDGKTLAEWEAISREDRSPARVIDAIQAIRALGKDDPQRAAQSILFTLRLHDPHASSNRGGFAASVGESVISAITELPAAARQQPLVTELRAGNRSSRTYLLDSMQSFVYGVKDTELIRNQVVELTRSDDSQISIAALACLRTNYPKDAATKQLMIDALDTSERSRQLIAADALVGYQYDPERLTATLSTALEQGTPMEKKAAALILSDLGKKAGAARAELIAILKSDDRSVWEPVYGTNPYLYSLGFRGHWALRTSAFSVRDAAILALAAIGEQSDELTALLENEPERRRKYEAAREVDMPGQVGSTVPQVNLVDYAKAILEGKPFELPAKAMGGGLF